MPEDGWQAPIGPATAGGRPHIVRPSPRIDGLTLERPSSKELAGSASGHVFAVDTPYLVVWSGWGEWFPAVGG